MTVSLEVARLNTAQEKRILALERELGCYVVALETQARRATLSAEQALRLEAMEKQLGVTLVAYEPAVTCELAKPPEHHLKLIRELEKSTGYMLVAYQQAHRDLDVEDFRLGAGLQQAHLNERQFEKLQSVEAETGLVLMAYETAKKDAVSN